MFTYFIYLAVGFIGGVLSTMLLPSLLFTNVNQLIVNLILDPITFVFGMLFFFIGFIANATLVRNGMELTYALLKRVNIDIREILLSSLVFISFTILFFINFSVALVFLIFSVLYGMISLNPRRYLQNEEQREEV